MSLHHYSNILIFTDLDGTLLDHYEYTFDAASEMLHFIRTHQIPLIFVTSKTKEEVIRIQKQVGISGPFIVENGAGIFIPHNNTHDVIAMGHDYHYVRQAFETYAKTVPMRGFFDMSIEEVIEHTQLSVERATDAKTRSFTEPFILKEDRDLDKLQKMADADGLAIVQGGRFYHLITKGQDKATAVKYLQKEYEKRYGHSFKTIALGDSANDLSMLTYADHPILIPHPDGSYLTCDIPHITKAPFHGSAGWNASLKEYFNGQ